MKKKKYKDSYEVFFKRKLKWINWMNRVMDDEFRRITAN